MVNSRVRYRNMLGKKKYSAKYAEARSSGGGKVGLSQNLKQRLVVSASAITGVLTCILKSADGYQPAF